MTRIQRPYTFSLLTGLALVCLVQWSTIDAFSQENPLTPTPSYPADSLIVPTNVPELNWWVGAPIDNMTFEVQIEIAASNEAVCNQPEWPSGITGTQQVTSECDPALLPGETYQWRVRASEDGLHSDWSDWAVFMTDGNGLAVAATPSYPVGDLEIFTTTPELHWFTEQNNTGIAFTAYLLGRDAGAPADCESIRTDDDAVTLSSVLGVTHVDAEVDPGSTYDWCVQSSGLNGDFDSEVASFTTAGPGMANAATPSYPVDGLDIYTTSPELHWYTGVDNNGVDFEAFYLKRDAGAPADCAVIRADGDTDSASSTGITHVDVSGLEPGATYDWCVRSSGPNGDFDSPVAHFSVAGGGVLSAPVASWPVGNAIVYQTSPSLHWYVEGSSVDLTGYDVEVCVAPDAFGDLGCSEQSGLVASQVTVGPLELGDVVSWRVRATYAAGPPSDWNNVASQGSFTVYGGLTTLTAVPTYPADDLLVYDTSINFSWYVTGAVGAADRFKVRYSQDETFPAGATQETESSSSHVLISDLEAGGSYWWQVAVSNDGGSTFGGWSDAASFAVDAGASAPMPRIGGPTNGIGVSTSSPTLSWIVPSTSTSDVVYDVRYAAEGGAYTEVTDLAAPFVQVESLEEGAYTWQVRARTVDGSSVSAYSDRGRFTTSARFGVNTEAVEDLPVAYELGQNYPNPFNPQTTIQYSVAASSYASITVYNVLGQVVKTLVDGMVPSGTHQVVWDATNDAGVPVPSGVYLYRMKVGASATSRMLVLMK